jgi:signal transduction histidine kinase
MFRAVMEATREAVVIMAPDGRVLHTNQAHDALFGRPVHHWRADYRALWAPTAQAAIDDELADGASRDGVFDAVGADGRVFPVWRRSGVARDARGRIQYHFAFLHDHSEQRRKDEARSRFLAAANHDLRQPVQALSMFVSVLANRTLGAAERKVVDRIEQAVSDVDTQISSLVEISRLDAGMVAPEFGPVDLSRVLDHLAEEFRPSPDQLELRILPCHAVVRSDGLLLERLLRPLVSNALRFTQQGRVLIGCRRQGDRVRLEVWDNGPGIPEHELQAVFTEFHRLANPGRPQGLGLGLAIVERLAALLGHHISVRSQPGRGTVFAVEMARQRDGVGGG